MMRVSRQQIAAALGGEARGDTVLAPGPGHRPIDRSLSVRIDEQAPGGFLVHSFANDDTIVCKDYVREKLGIRDERPPSRETPSVEYVYKLGDGTPYLRVNRLPGKRFFQQHWNGSAWINGAPSGKKIPYRLPDLLAAEHDTVLVVEGEKDVDNVTALGFTATTNAGGAGNWHSDLNQYFMGRDVFVIPDNDSAGEQHAQKVAEGLTGIAREIRIVRLPNLAPKGDVSNWIAAGGTAEQLADILRAAPEEVLNESASSLAVAEPYERAEPEPISPLSTMTPAAWRGNQP
jgi:hypothetical protein